MVNKEFVDKYIDKIFVTPEEKGTLRLDIRILTGTSTEKFLQKLTRHTGQITPPEAEPVKELAFAGVSGDGSRTGHMFKKMIEAYENGMK
jgi:hypothetical protein